jgi:L-arabinonolactonase
VVVTVTAPAPQDILQVRNILGECVLWHPRHNALWWTDIQASRLQRYDWTTGALQTLEAPERIASFGFVAASDSLITAFASGLALYDPRQRTVHWLARPCASDPGVRFNDGRVDRRGRFWSGTMVEDTPPAAARGCLYCLQGAGLQGAGLQGAGLQGTGLQGTGPQVAGEAYCHIRGIRISNGLCFSPDGTRLYFADSPTRIISVYDLIEPEGVLGTRRTLAQTPEGSSPDGATVDVDGCIWTALWGAGCVVRYTPDGRLDRTLPLPVSQPTCVCFAGPNLDILCVTSAKAGLDDSRLHDEPHAGDVFLYRVGTQGLPESEYRA